MQDLCQVIQGKEKLCIENDFYIYKQDKAGLIDSPCRIDEHICCIYLQGETRGRINLIPYQQRALGMSILIPGQILEIESISDDFEGICILMSKNFVSSLELPHSFQTYMSVQENPIIPLTDNQFEAMISYCTMVSHVLEKKHPNKSEIIKHLTCAFFYGIGYYFHQIAENKVLSNDEALMQNFLKEVQLSYKRERKVLFYADKMNLTAGYLSTVIKKTSGKTAAEWIDDYVLLEAKALLKTTGMTIQQVSDELNFPSQSFFGKFFKRLANLSPKEYRDGKKK